MLQVKPLAQDTGLYNIWKSFRDLADVMFILVFLVLIFGNLIGTEGSSYQLKSLLPKLVIAAIGVQISFYVTAFIIDIGNVSGAGVGAIFSQLGSQTGNAKDVSTGLSEGSYHLGAIFTIGLAALSTVIATAVLTWPLILLTLGGFMISILGVFATLALRQLIIALLIVLSPLAFTAWILPNTTHFFKHWHQNLIRVILVYPMIVILLSIGGFVARIANSESGLLFGSKAVNQIFASILPILVFLAIPATFKAASGLMARATDTVFNRHDKIKGQLGGSQFRKDLKESRQEKGFIARRDGSKWVVPGTGYSLQRGLGRARAGQPGLGQPGRRRLAKGYDTAMGAQMKDWGIRFDDLGLSNKQLAEDVVLAGHGNTFTYTAKDGSTRHETITKAMQAQAIAQIAKQGGNLELNQIYDQIFDPTADNYRGDYKAGLGLPSGAETADTWFRGVGSSGVFPQIIQAIPVTNPGKRNKAHDGLSASQVASMHGTSAPWYYNRVMANTGSESNPADVTAGRHERASRVLRNFATIASSADNRSKVDQALVKYFKDQVNTNADFRNIMASETIRYNKHDITGVEFFDRYVDVDGKIAHEGLPGTPI